MRKLRSDFGCPVEFAVELIGGKWKTVILSWLKEAPHRYSELRQRIPGLSDKVLTQRLKDLEGLGFVKRSPAGRSGGYVYELTDLGKSLRPVLDALYAWGETVAARRGQRIAQR